MYFLSYSHQNKVEAETICDVLKKAGREVWFDPSLAIGEQYNITIAEAIQNCDCFVAVFSLSYFKSMYCKKELIYALEKLHKKILPIVIEDNLEMPPEIELLMSGITLFFMTDGVNEGSLLNELKKPDVVADNQEDVIVISDYEEIPITEKMAIIKYCRELQFGEPKRKLRFSITSEKIKKMKELLHTLDSKIDENRDLNDNELFLQRRLPSLIEDFEFRVKIIEYACTMAANDRDMISYLDEMDMPNIIHEIAVLDYYEEIAEKRKDKKYILLDCYQGKISFTIPVEREVVFSILKNNLNIEGNNVLFYLQMQDMLLIDLPKYEIKKILKFLYYGLAECSREYDFIYPQRKLLNFKLGLH